MSDSVFVGLDVSGQTLEVRKLLTSLNVMAKKGSAWDSTLHLA